MAARRRGRMAARGAGAATGGTAMKKRGHETMKLKGRNALPVARHRGPTAADLQKQLDQRTRELAEALEQQATTSEILGIVARSPTNVQSVLDGICQSAARLCDAYDSAIWVPGRGSARARRPSRADHCPRVSPAGAWDSRGPIGSREADLPYC